MPIEDMIDRLADKDYAAAKQEFDDIMQGKLSDALEAEKIKLASQIYNDEDLEEVDPEAISDEDLEAAAEEEVEGEDFESEDDPETE